jgi:tripartite-type tricarboxylate transporter receptor subunit TctC
MKCAGDGRAGAKPDRKFALTAFITEGQYMSLQSFIVRTLLTALTLSCTSACFAQTYPAKPIRVTTTEAGSGGDFTIRSIAPLLNASLGQPIVVDNRGAVAMPITAKAPPDGYTLVLYGSPLWLLPLMRESLSWDPMKDFAPISLLVSAPNILVVHPSSPAKSVKELINLAKAQPGQLNYSSGLAGTASHLSGELFKSMAGINIVRVAYKGTGPALNALIGQQVQMMFSAASAAVPHIKSGRLRALAATSAQPSALLPDLPTVAASGLAGYESELPFALFAPARTPASIVQRLNAETVRALNEPATKERFLNAGTEVVASSPAQLTAIVKSDMTRWGKVIKDAAIRDE